MCGLWHHIKCEGVSEKSYKLIGEGEIHGLRWFCKKCDQFAANIMTTIKKLTARLNQIEEKTESRVARVEERVAKVEEREKEQTNKIEGTIERIEGIEGGIKDEPLREVTDEDIKNQISLATSSFLKEKEEKDTRKMNVVVNNVPESEGETAKEKKEKDKQKCLKQFEKIVDISEADIESIVRLGAATDKPRPIKIKLKCENLRNDLIRNAREINEGVEVSERIYINRDETREERKRGKELRDERKLRMSKGETGLIIRGGRIIKKAEIREEDNEEREEGEDSNWN